MPFRGRPVGSDSGGSGTGTEMCFESGHASRSQNTQFSDVFCYLMIHGVILEVLFLLEARFQFHRGEVGYLKTGLICFESDYVRVYHL